MIGTRWLYCLVFLLYVNLQTSETYNLNFNVNFFVRAIFARLPPLASAAGAARTPAVPRYASVLWYLLYSLHG